MDFFLINLPLSRTFTWFSFNLFTQKLKNSYLNGAEGRMSWEDEWISESISNDSTSDSVVSFLGMN